MTIRTRAFVGLWLICILAAAAIALIVYSFSLQNRLDRSEQRSSEILNVHGTLWRSLVEARTNHLAFALSGAQSLRDQRDAGRRVYTGSISQLTGLVEDRVQLERLARVRTLAAAWMDLWESVPATRLTATDDERLIAAIDADFAALNRELMAFDAYERDQLSRLIQESADLRTQFAFGRAGFAAMFVGVISLILLYAKRGVLDPLRELTDSAERIAHGDFAAAHQTLRADEIGVLFNSFAKMAQSIQSRERELATALTETRELAAVTVESRRRVEAAHADLLATLETVPAARAGL